jgi:hypothetical protein
MALEANVPNVSPRAHFIQELENEQKKNLQNVADSVQKSRAGFLHRKQSEPFLYKSRWATFVQNLPFFAEGYSLFPTPLSILKPL